jgi:hypothetical protein
MKKRFRGGGGVVLPVGLAMLVAASLAAGDAATRPGAEARDYAGHAAALKKRVPAGFPVLVQAPFVVTGNDTEAHLREYSAHTVVWAVTHLKADFFAKDPTDIIDIYLFTDADAYQKYAKELLHDTPTTPYGYYSPVHKALVMNIGTGGGTLVHEIVHPFMAANFPECPSWFNEGLASLFEQSAERDGHIVGQTNWRLAGLQQAIREKKLPTFKNLTATTTDQFYGDQRGVNYAMARYLLYYLQQQGKLRDYYQAFAAGVKTDPTGYDVLQKTLGEKDMADFQRRWEAWVMGLRFP